ncbi:hypothetical protein [Alloactinosynnema sp. L-07]|uniref:DUF397 domain-containing protein n=1 Tax=Alloactinosynnema sp. L-07 TaxID=1653480 RepID=UPI00065EF79C|nr:DUF397 domain-containing protein [Alloactinosynnema sp. L-07]CRK61006.1 hypothetical protein [Alloactinosynnema sp. L-07]
MHGEWRKSTFSHPNQADCVEVAFATEVRVRDSKNPSGGVLTFPVPTWFPRRVPANV